MVEAATAAARVAAELVAAMEVAVMVGGERWTPIEVPKRLLFGICKSTASLTHSESTCNLHETYMCACRVEGQ